MRQKIAFFWVLFLAISGFAAAQHATSDSPRLKALSTLVDFFSTRGDEAVDRFIEDHIDASMKAEHGGQLKDRLAQLRQEFAGAQARGGEPTGPYSAAIVFQAPSDKGRSRLKFELTSESPHRFTHIEFEAEETLKPLNGALRQQVVESISETLIEGYIYEEAARKMAAHIRARRQEGAYDSLTDHVQFADRLTRDLREISSDLHLRIRYAAPPPSRGRPNRPPQEGEGPEDYGFVKDEILDGNVGYIDMRSFQWSEEALAKCDEMMARMAGAEALIIDLGRNGGGGEPMVKHLSAYLFAGDTHLVNTFMRGWDEPHQRWTAEGIQGKRLPDVPVYVLTSRRTFSAAESFTFGLKINDRITQVGERTGGGGHWGGPRPLVHDYSVWLPRGRTYDPETGKGWEAEGIQPDIEVPYAEALQTAHRHALKRLGKESAQAVPSGSARLEEFKSRVEELVQRGEFSGTVQLARDGQVVFQRAYGLADREKNLPNRLDTKFNVGSMNKMITAVAILQLAEGGKLSVEDRLIDVWPDYPNREVASKITLHQMLTHTSGLGDYLGPLFRRSENDIFEVMDHLPLFAGDALRFEPGSQWAYSNAGFMVLGGVVEKVSGQRYADYIQENILDPAGMKNTGFAFYEDPKVEGIATNYAKPRDGNGEVRVFVHPGQGGPAGGGYSTVADWVRFGQALKSNKLLSPEMTRLMTEGKTQVRDNSYYGYGIIERRHPNRRESGHGGGAPGINGELAIYWDTGWVISVLANINPPAASKVKRAFEEVMLEGR